MNLSNPSSAPQIPTHNLIPDQQKFLNHVKRYYYTKDYVQLQSQPLGKGAGGAILPVQHIQTGKICAMKLVKESASSMNEVSLQFLAQQGCHKIVKFEDVYHNYFLETDNHGVGRQVLCFVIIMELCQGGALFDAAFGPPEKNWNFNQREVAEIIKQVAEAVNHLHYNLGIAHRDLKPENILLRSTKNQDTCDNQPRVIDIALADFGFAKKSRNPEHQAAFSTPKFTPNFKAPEIKLTRINDFAANYDEGVDLWSLGVILYMLLVKQAPFFSTTGQQNQMTPGMEKMINEGRYARDESEAYRNLPIEAKDLIDKMLRVDRSQRIGIHQVIQHPYITEKDHQAVEISQKIDERTASQLSSYMTKNLFDQRPKSGKINFEIPKKVDIGVSSGRQNPSRLRKSWPKNASKKVQEAEK